MLTTFCLFGKTQLSLRSTMDKIAKQTSDPVSETDYFIQTNHPGQITAVDTSNRQAGTK